jgi:hypothetical protein
MVIMVEIGSKIRWHQLSSAPFANPESFDSAPPVHLKPANGEGLGTQDECT